MSNSDFTDQLFLAFAAIVLSKSSALQIEDQAPVINFHSLLSKGQPLTVSQSQYVLRLLSKYRTLIEKHHIDPSAIDKPKWSQPFRVIDTSKKVYIEKNDNGIFICVKQPFNLKEIFEKQCVKENADWRDSVWNAEEKVRKYTFRAVNPILVKDFADQKKYEQSQDFIDLVENIEQIYEDQEKYIACSRVVEEKVELVNYTESARVYFDEHKINSTIDDLLLAKSLGYPCEESGSTTARKICATQSNSFWIKDLQKFVDLCFSIKGQTVIVLTKEKSKAWLSHLLSVVERRGYEKSKVKIGFRANTSEDADFNDWIRNEGLGGDLSNGKILVFKDKVPKWLIEKDIDVTIVASAGPFLPSSAISQTWINQQSCVVFLGDIKPSSTKGQKIVEL